MTAPAPPIIYIVSLLSLVLGPEGIDIVIVALVAKGMVEAVVVVDKSKVDDGINADVVTIVLTGNVVTATDTVEDSCIVGVAV